MGAARCIKWASADLYWWLFSVLHRLKLMLLLQYLPNFLSSNNNNNALGGCFDWHEILIRLRTIHQHRSLCWWKDFGSNETDQCHAIPQNLWEKSKQRSERKFLSPLEEFRKFTRGGGGALYDGDPMDSASSLPHFHVASREAWSVAVCCDMRAFCPYWHNHSSSTNRTATCSSDKVRRGCPKGLQQATYPGPAMWTASGSRPDHTRRWPTAWCCCLRIVVRNLCTQSSWSIKIITNIHLNKA